MPRKTRQKSKSGIYHVMLRGINRQNIFYDIEDNEKFIEILSTCKKISGFKIFGYCLMGNHIHLLIKEEVESLELIFKRIGARYVYWYNWKYYRSGHLFQDRFRSEPIESEGYLITVLRYIHQNPKKSGLSNSIDKYKWSSYNEYIGKQGITDTDFVLNLMDKDEFIKFMNEENQDKILDIEEDKRLTDEEVIERITKEYNIQPLMMQKEPRERMKIMIREILKQEGVSTRQLSRVTGISPNIIWKLGSK